MWWSLFKAVEWYNWVHWSIALLGNISFLIGSIMYVEGSMQHVGTWFFVAGAAGMLVGRLGTTFMELEYKRLYHQWEQMENDTRGRNASNQ